MFKQRVAAKKTNPSYVEKTGDFPELVSSNKIITRGDSVDYKSIIDNSIIVAELPNELIDYSILPGWVVLSETNTHYKIFETEVDNSEYDPEFYHDMVCHHIDKMEERWNHYKQTYIELYGEEEYHRLYEMPDSYYSLLDEE